MLICTCGLYCLSPAPFLIQRDQLHQRDVLVQSLRQELGKVAESSRGASEHQQREREEGGLIRENASLKDENARLSEELFRMRETNRKLEEVCVLFPLVLHVEFLYWYAGSKMDPHSKPLYIGRFCSMSSLERIESTKCTVIHFQVNHSPFKIFIPEKYTVCSTLLLY